MVVDIVTWRCQKMGPPNRQWKAFVVNAFTMLPNMAQVKGRLLATKCIWVKSRITLFFYFTLLSPDLQRYLLTMRKIDRSQPHPWRGFPNEQLYCQWLIPLHLFTGTNVIHRRTISSELFWTSSLWDCNSWKLIWKKRRLMGFHSLCSRVKDLKRNLCQ